MSLIHDALKKAQNKENAPLGSGLSTFQEPVGEKNKPSTKRIAVMAAILVVALGFFAYKKFSSSPQPPLTPLATPVQTLPAGALQQSMPSGDIAAMKKRAVDSFRSDDYDTAMTSLSSASQLAPNDPEVWNDMGLVQKKRGDMGKAKESYQKALDLKPDYPEALNNMAVLERDQGDSVKARELLEKAIKLQPAYPEASFNLALLYDKAGERAKAAEYYKRFLEVSGSYPNTIVEAVRDRVMEIEPQ
ncbi:MAG: tetratricopeptide repeat protein [bacterium]